VAVSPIGMNLEILAMGQIGVPCSRSGDWYESLSFLYNHRDAAINYGRTGRRIVEQHFSRELVTANIAGVFQALA